MSITVLGSSNVGIGALQIHATTHEAGGTDELDVTALGGFPGGTGTFLRADGTFATAGGGGGGSANAGTATVDFGAFPGATDASVAVTGQSGILSGSVVMASMRMVATSDHSADEHFVEEMDVVAGNISAGVGFTIYAKARNHRLYGQWTLGWSWI